jgi:hypothetical protein
MIVPLDTLLDGPVVGVAKPVVPTGGDLESR